MKKKQNESNEGGKGKLMTPLGGGILLILAVVVWSLSHILNCGWDWGFTEPSIVLFALMGMALLLFPHLEEFSLPGGIGFKLRRVVEEIQDIQLIGEVVFNKDEKGDRHLFWIGEKGEKRAIPNLDTASLFATQKGFMGISKNRFTRIEGGTDLPPISKKSFRRTEEGNFFVILDGKIFYLSSMSLPIKYGWMDNLDKITRITDEEIRENQIFR